MNFLVAVSAANVLYPLLFTLFSVAVVAVFVWLTVRTLGKATEGGEQSEKKPNFTALLLVLLVIGFILRLIFAFAVKGNRTEARLFATLFSDLKSEGFGKNHYALRGTDVFPLTYYVYAFMGLFVNLFGLGTESAFWGLFVKLPLIVADLVTAFVLYKLAKKYLNEAVATVVAGFVCIFPVFVFASGVWATQYSLLAMITALTLYFLVNKNYIATVGCYAAALLTHKDAMYLFPVVAVFVIYGLVKASMAVHAQKGLTFKEVLSSPTYRPVFTVPVSIVGFLLLSYLLSLPVMIGSFGAGFFTFMYRLYLKPLTAFTLFGHNSLGIFNLFLRNGKELNARFPAAVFTVLFAVIVTGIVLLVYLSRKNRANLVFLAAYVLFTLATYFVGFSEFGLLTALVVFLISFFLIRDKRILHIFGALSLLIMVNASAVMASAGYYNNLADYYFTSTAGYTGTEILTGGATAVTIVCSALAVLTHLYATVVLLDISMSNRRKILPFDENASFGAAMAAFLRLKNDR